MVLITHPHTSHNQSNWGITYSILKFVIEMLNVKVMTNLSNKGLDMLLELMTKVLPKGNLVPRSTYEAKKILCDLGIDVDKNGGYSQ